MENNSFHKFFDWYLDVWRNSSLSELETIISKDYKAREISGGKLVDFGFDESITGWEQGFNFAREKGNKWDLHEISIVPLREN